jgi:hypothetical protein
VIGELSRPFSPFAAWFPGGATVLQTLLLDLSHGSQNPSIIAFRKLQNKFNFINFPE